VGGKNDGTDDICHVYGDEETEITNARLIAASPELLFDLKRIIRAADEGCDEAVWELIELARCSVSKAENG
jgi:hypothetical protein